MFRPIDSYTAVRAMTLNGHAYAPGEVIDRNDIIHSRQSDALLSKKLIIVTPDPHGRKTKDWMPTPISTPASYRKGGGGPSAPPTSVTVTPPSSQGHPIGGTQQFTAVVNPPEADQSVTWEADSPNIATVTSTGLGTVHEYGAPGIIRARSVADTTKSYNSSMSATPDSIVVDKPTVSVGVGETETVTASPVPAGPGAITYFWQSSDTSVATVSMAGVITGVAAGTATITCLLQSDTSIRTTVAVTVSEPATIVTNQEDCVIEQIGWSVNIWCWVEPTDSSAVYTWTVANPSLAHVVPSPPSNSDVYIYGDAEGSTSVEISTVTNGQTVTKTIPITVLNPPPAVTVTVFPTAHSQPAGVGDFLVNAYVDPTTETQQVTWEDPAGVFTLTPDAMGPMTCGVAVNAGASGTYDLIARHVENTSATAICSVTATAMADPASLEAEQKEPPKKQTPKRKRGH